MATSRVSKYFNETPEERATRLRMEEPPIPKKRVLKTVIQASQPSHKGLPFTNHRTLAEAWKYYRYDTWKKR